MEIKNTTNKEKYFEVWIWKLSRTDQEVIMFYTADTLWNKQKMFRHRATSTVKTALPGGSRQT